MSRTQVRPRGGGDAYSPQRDLAYCYPPAMKEALRALDKERWTDEVRALFRTLHVTENEVSRAVKALTDAHTAFIMDPQVKCAVDALRNAGWYNQRAEVRYLIYGRLGEVMLGGFFLAIRDVRMLGEEPPHSREIADFIVEGLRVARLYDLERPPEISPPAPVEKSALVQLQFTRRALEEQQLECNRLQHRCRLEAREARKAVAAESLIAGINGLGLWSGICRAIRVWRDGRKNPIPAESKRS